MVWSALAGRIRLPATANQAPPSLNSRSALVRPIFIRSGSLIAAELRPRNAQNNSAAMPETLTGRVYLARLPGLVARRLRLDAVERGRVRRLCPRVKGLPHKYLNSNFG